MKIELAGKKLTITVDLSTVTPTPSKSGKSLVLASTNGNQVIGMLDNKPIVMGLNLYTKN